MASLVLGAVGTAIGAGFGGITLLGTAISGAAIGGMIGSAVGSVVDSWLIASMAPGQRIEGARLDSLRVTSATEGAIVARLYGRMRVGGNIIWATDFREETSTTTSGGKGGGGGGRVTTTEYLYSASFAVALCEGPISGVGRVWADGKPMDMEGVTWRWYPGGEDQAPDPFIAAKMGAENTPAYRGIAYVVFEELPLEAFGNRLPQLTFEVFRTLDDAESAEGMVEAVTIIPASGEFAYATELVRKTAGGATSAENAVAIPGRADFRVSLDRLEASAPKLRNASLVVAWFGDDLRAGLCRIQPRVEAAVKDTTPAWQVNGLTRAAAPVVSQVEGRPAFGGTPSDASVVQAIQELKARGLGVTFYPFLLMDIPAGNTKPDPYRDHAATLGQPVFPWRGRITCSPAPGQAGTVDKTAAAATQVSTIFGTATPAQFAVSGTTVTFTGPAGEWSLRRMVLHYAHLSKAAGGVDTFIIGSELRGLTQVRSGASTYPAVAALRALAADVRRILGPGVRITYAADWSEYAGHRPEDGSGDLYFHLDPLWADEAIDVIGIDNYMPLSDWRDGQDHLDAAPDRTIHSRTYLQSNIEGGEGHDWFYANATDRALQLRTPIADSLPFVRDAAVANGTPAPWVIGPTGLVANAVHAEIGRGGYFHPASGTSEGQFILIWASAIAARALQASRPDLAASWSERSRLLAAPLEEVFYRRPFDGNPATTFLPHWLNGAKGRVQLQEIVLGAEVDFVSIGGGRMRGTIPRALKGHLVGKVYHVRALDASLLWQNPYSPVIGTTYPLDGSPEIDSEGCTIKVVAPGASMRALVCYSHDDGRLLETGAPYEAWPTWRLLEPTEIACAGDSLRWSLLAFDAMDALHGGSRWSSMREVAKANTLRAFEVDDARWIFRPMVESDQQVSGTFVYETRATTWYREIPSGYVRADIASGSGESQLGKLITLDLPAGDSMVARIGSSVPSGAVAVFLDTAVSFSPATRYWAWLNLSGTGIQTFTLPLASFTRMSDGAPLTGPVTIRVAGLIDVIPVPHTMRLVSFRPLSQDPHPYVPWLVPFTTNMLNGEVISWRGVPGIGYQAPDVWMEIGGADAATGARVQAEFLRDAQDAWQATTGVRGPMAHAYVWDRPEADDVGGTPGSWIYTWHDPNSFWGGYQYRAIDATARYLWRADGLAAHATGRATALQVLSDFLTWLDGAWTSGALPPPTTFLPTGVITDYDEPHLAALILRACTYLRKAGDWNATGTRRDLADRLALKAWTYLDSRWTLAGSMRGAWSGGEALYYGYWHGEIVATLAELLLLDPPFRASLVWLEALHDRLQAADDWLTAHTGAALVEEQGEPWVFRVKGLRDWWRRWHFNRPGGARAAEPTVWQPQSKPIVFTEFGCPAIDRGANQPNVFVDPRSSEGAVPHASRGWRDDAMQRAYLEATLGYWSDPAHNPVSSVYGATMVDLAHCAAWTWDARPYPFFPQISDVWADGENWRLGHWLTGRLGSVSLAALVRDLCTRAGLPPERVDVSGLWGAVEGFAITALEAPRTSLGTLARHFGFDAVESEGVLRFRMRGMGPIAEVSPEDMVAADAGRGEPFELVRGQETELPQALKWQLARSDEEFDAVVVEARRVTVAASRVTAEAFPMAVPPEEGERRCRRALQEVWVGRETASFRLPPSRLALDPGDVIDLAQDGRRMQLRLLSVADGPARGISAIRQDQAVHDLPPGQPRATGLTRAVVFGAPEVLLLDLPQLAEDEVAHQPRMAANAKPWPGSLAVFRSLSDDGFTLLDRVTGRATVGVLASALKAGPTSRWDLANSVEVDLPGGQLSSVTDLALFGGANAFAVESALGAWEILQAARADLVALGRYRLSRLLRGQRGTEQAMVASVAPGARIVVLDDTLARLRITPADLGLPWRWRIGPASLPLTDASYAEVAFTPTGRGLKPFAVAHVEQPASRGRTPGDLTIRWTRRDRALVADSWEVADVPMSEGVEAYEVVILDGAAVKRRLQAATTSVVYTGAAQIADWGALLGPGDSLDIRIAQLSQLAGGGTPRSVRLTF